MRTSFAFYHSWNNMLIFYLLQCTISVGFSICCNRGKGVTVNQLLVPCTEYVCRVNHIGSFRSVGGYSLINRGMLLSCYSCTTLIVFKIYCWLKVDLTSFIFGAKVSSCLAHEDAMQKWHFELILVEL